MADFEQLIEKAVEKKDIPGCVLQAVNRDGSFRYAKAYGTRSLREGSGQPPLELSTIMWVASCTKLMTSICALQLVERGQITLDEPVYKYIPELKDFPVIKGIKEDGTPIEEPHKNPITLRLLLTHSSGIAYDGIHPSLVAWLKYHNKEPGTSGKILERYNTPLVFEPGEAWMYGPSIDYAGLLIERVSGLNLEEFMKKNLWEPLGIKDMTFHLASRPDLQARFADMSFRDDPDGPVRYSNDRWPYQDGEGKEASDCMGGQGVFTSPEEYIKVVHAALTMDVDEKLLKKQTVEEFFKPQLGPGSSAAMNAMLKNPIVNNAMGGIPMHIKTDWGLGGILLTADSPDGKAAGSMLWGGLPNIIWWIDRKTGLCGLYAGQVLPTGDAKCAALDRKFEAGMYELYRKSRNA